MTEFGIPFDMPQNPDNPDDYLFSAAEERMRIGAQMTDGVFPEIRLITTDATAPEQVVGNSLVVTAGEGMNVILGKGIALCGSTFYFNTAEKIIPVSEGINDIVIELNLADDKISAINQTRVDGNIEDSLVRTVSRWQIALATVTVPEGTETIDFSMITDHRLNTTPCSSPDGRPVCGLVGSALQLSADMILDEWNYIKGRLSEDQAGQLLFMIGDIRDLQTENKRNLVEAINELVNRRDIEKVVELIFEGMCNIYHAYLYDLTGPANFVIPAGTKAQQNDLYSYDEIVLDENGNGQGIFQINSTGSFTAPKTIDITNDDNTITGALASTTRYNIQETTKPITDYSNIVIVPWDKSKGEWESGIVIPSEVIDNTLDEQDELFIRIEDADEDPRFLKYNSRIGVSVRANIRIYGINYKIKEVTNENIS